MCFYYGIESRQNTQKSEIIFLTILSTIRVPVITNKDLARSWGHYYHARICS